MQTSSLLFGVGRDLFGYIIWCSIFSILGACRIDIYLDLWGYMVEHIFELNPTNPTPYMILLNFYLIAGRWRAHWRRTNLNATTSEVDNWIRLINAIIRDIIEWFSRRTNLNATMREVGNWNILLNSTMRQVGNWIRLLRCFL